MSTQNSSQLQNGSLVTYDQDAKLIPGVIIGSGKSGFEILNIHGGTVRLKEPRIHLLPGAPEDSSTGKEILIQKLEALFKQASIFAKEVSIEDLWQHTHEENREFSNEELCEIYFSAQTREQHLAIRIALVEDRLFFKRKKAGFLPRTEEVIEQLKKAEIQEQKKAEEREALIEYFSSSEENASSPETIKPWIELLLNIACGVEAVEGKRKKEIQHILEGVAKQQQKELRGTPEQQILHLLKSRGFITPTFNPIIRRAQIPIEFTDEILTASESLQKNLETQIQCADREKLTSLNCVTVDDVSTRDMDDAISLEQTPEGYQLGIHISDVGAIIDPIGSSTDRDARERATSLYCPEQTIHMLPPILSENLCSLVEGEARPTISVLVNFDSSFQMLSYRILPTLIEVKKRLSYQEVDILLENEDPFFLNLYQITSQLESQRIADGAVRIDKNDVAVKVDDNGNVSVEEFEEHCPSRALIGELMILANTCFAEYAVDQEVPLFFRGQEQSDERSIPASIPDGPASEYAKRMTLKRSITSFQAIPHASLGLQAYAQGTSPIRRFTDLCNQRQIAACLLNKPIPYQKENFLEIQSGLEEAIQRAAVASRNSKRFWILRYLKNTLPPKDAILSGTVLRTDLKNPLIELNQVYLSVLAQSNRKLQPGDQVQLKVRSLDPWFDQLRLEVIN